MSKRGVVWFCLVVLASVWAYGQGVSLDVKNAGAEVMTRSRGLVVVNCSTNVTCTQVNGQWTITATGTSYADNLPHWTGAGPALFDNGIITGAGSAQDGTAIINKLVEASGANLVLAGTANAGNPVFIVRNIRDAGHIDVCTAGEQCSCVFDGATTAGHHVGKSTTAGGSCKDLGVAGSADPPAGVRSIGTVLTTNGAGGTYVVQLGQGYKQASTATASVGGLVPQPPNDNTKAFCGDATWGTTCKGSGGTANQVYSTEWLSWSATYLAAVADTPKIEPFVTPGSGVAFSKIMVWIGTADGTNASSWGILNSSGAVVCHVTATTYAGTGATDTSCAEGTVTLTGNTAYYFAYTSKATTITLRYSQGGVGSAMGAGSLANCGSVTAGSGDLNTITGCTPGAVGWGASQSRVVFVLHQ